MPRLWFSYLAVRRVPGLYSGLYSVFSIMMSDVSQHVPGTSSVSEKITSQNYTAQPHNPTQLYFIWIWSTGLNTSVFHNLPIVPGIWFPVAFALSGRVCTALLMNPRASMHGSLVHTQITLGSSSTTLPSRRLGRRASGVAIISIGSPE